MGRLEEIFKRQAAYVESLTPTLRRNNLWIDAYPLDLNNRHAQEHFRLLAWRLTEEICEALNVVNLALDGIDSSDEARATFNEEVADALHFLVELCLATGVTKDEFLSGTEEDGLVLYDGISELDSLGLLFRDSLRFISYAQRKQVQEGRFTAPKWCEVIVQLGLAMQSLRQRPWRTDDRPTERKDWVLGLHLTFRKFVECCILSGIGSTTLYEAYFAKAKINDERQLQQ